MIYHGTYAKEVIAVHPMDDMKRTNFIELCKNADDPTFSVEVDDGFDTWFWEFIMEDNSIYERVKINIFDAIFECETMDKLVSVLDDVFHDGFKGVLIEDEECDGDCENCSCHEK